MADEIQPVRPWLSKTILLNVVVSIAGILGMLGVPAVNQFVSGHTDLILTGLGALGIVLRLVTKGAIELK